MSKDEKRISIFYFSGTGNTKWVVERFQVIWLDMKQQIELYPIEDSNEMTDVNLFGIMKESDYIGFANPIYGADIPVIMKKFIARVVAVLGDNRLSGRRIFSINTCGYVNAFGPIAMQKIFQHSGSRLRAYINIVLCINITVPGKKTGKIKEKSLQNRKCRAVRKLKKLADCLIEDHRYIRGIGAYLIPGIVIRKKLQKGILENYKELSVDDKTCTNCMRCLNECPTHCIRKVEEKFVFEPGCTACMRCYNFCPTASIRLKGVTADPQIYPRYKGPGL